MQKLPGDSKVHLWVENANDSVCSHAAWSSGCKDQRHMAVAAVPSTPPMGTVYAI